MAGLLSNLKDVIDIVKLVYTRDAKLAPRSAPPLIVHADVRASVEDHNPKLHGNEVIVWDEPVIRCHHDVYVLGLYPDLGKQGEGFGVVFDKDIGLNTLARIANVRRFRRFGTIPNYTLLICEEVATS